jgi:hypothetical protein
MAGALAQARTKLVSARERIAGLQARLNQNPRNSSKPPSSEGLAKPAPKPRSLRMWSGRKPGGQDGHKGATLTQAARPDREIRHEPACCGRCGTGLADRPVTAVERRQVFDLQPVRAEVTEHQLIERECGCGHRTKATAPAGAGAVRAADRRGHRLPVRRAVPVQGPHRAGAGPCRIATVPGCLSSTRWNTAPLRVMTTYPPGTASRAGGPVSRPRGPLNDARLSQAGNTERPIMGHLKRPA